MYKKGVRDGMKHPNGMKTTLLFLLAAVMLVSAGCAGTGSSLVSSSGNGASGTSSATRTDSKGSDSEEGASSGEASQSNSSQAPAAASSGKGSPAKPASSTKTSSASTTDPGPYDYGRTQVSADWNNRFNISTGFAMGGSGNRAMYDKIVSQTKDAYFTTIEITSVDTAAPDPDGAAKEGVRQVIKTALDACRKYQIGAYVSDPYMCGGGATYRNIDERHVKEALDAYKDYSDVIQAYILWDEPFKEQFPIIKQRMDWIRKYDANTRLFLNLFPSYGQYGWSNTTWDSDSYTGYVDDFVSQVNPDMLSLDYYVFGNKTDCNADVLSGSQMLWRDLGYYRMKSLEANKPLEFYIQGAGDFSDVFDRIGKMSIERISFQMWTALAYGVKRISYWTSYGVLLDGNGDKTRLYDPIKNLNKEALTVGQFLYDKTPDKIYHSGAGNLELVRKSYNIDNLAESTLLSEIPSESIVSTFKDASGGQYIMIANKDYSYPTEGRLVFKSAKRLSKFNAAANRLEAPSMAVNSLEMKIPAGGYALYKIN